MIKIEKIKDRKDTFLFLLLVFSLYLTVVFLLPYNGAPDEAMRYQIPKYIYEYSSLPRGDAPEILDETWGISYAFTPINTYIFSALLMKFVGLFGEDALSLLYAARLVSMLFSMGTVIFCLKIGARLFDGIYRWLFVLTVALLPEFIYISGYVNCDSIAVFSVAWIIYALLCGKDKSWDTKSCIFLGCGLGFCALSYYNAYGMILFGAVYCLFSVILDKDIENKVQFLLIRTGWAALSAFLVAGWWFIRNGFLYGGDIMGMRASSECAELNAAENFKPSNRATPSNLGYSLKYVLIDMQWIKSSMQSFVAAFGYMEYFLEEIYYKIYYCLMGIGFFGNIIALIPYLRKKKKINWDKALFYGCMCGVCAFTIALSLYYSYFNDFQAQGRYCMPMLVPLALLITAGARSIGACLNEKAASGIAHVMCLFMLGLSFYSMFCVLYVKY